jgi:hypothetical protein
MLKKTITYKDFNGVEHTEDFYFNLTNAEIVEMEISENLKGGFGDMIKAIVASQDGRQIVPLFKEIILKAYGVRSSDGRTFKKSQELRDEFAATGAFSVLFVELATQADAATVFINGIAPADLGETAALIAANTPRPQAAPATPALPLYTERVGEAPVPVEIPQLVPDTPPMSAPSPTRADLDNMSTEELNAYLARRQAQQ